MIKESYFNPTPEPVRQQDFASWYIESLPADPRPLLPQELCVQGLKTFGAAWRVRNGLIYQYKCALGCDIETGLFYVIAPVVFTGKQV